MTWKTLKHKNIKKIMQDERTHINIFGLLTFKYTAHSKSYLPVFTSLVLIFFDTVGAETVLTSRSLFT